MSITAKVGLSKKVGLPHYGSVGASCEFEVEVDAAVLSRDPAEVHKQLQATYQACRQAVEAELSRHRPAKEERSSNGRGSNGDGQGKPATPKQIEYARNLAEAPGGVGAEQLDMLCQKMFQQPFAEINSLQASNLIDTLKQIRDGSIDLESALEAAS